MGNLTKYGYQNRWQMEWSLIDKRKINNHQNNYFAGGAKQLFIVLRILREGLNNCLWSYAFYERVKTTVYGLTHFAGGAKQLFMGLRILREGLNNCLWSYAFCGRV
jgi:hypothetical protein